MTTTLVCKRLSEHAILPTRGTPESAGLDLYAPHDVTIHKDERVLIPLDLRITRFPAGTYAQLYSRSSLAFKHGFDVCAGTIDPDFRGNVGVLVHNRGAQDFLITKGERFAQLVLHRYEHAEVSEDTEENDGHEQTWTRGEGGFGSTGR